MLSGRAKKVDLHLNEKSTEKYEIKTLLGITKSIFSALCKAMNKFLINNLYNSLEFGSPMLADCL